MTWYVNDFTYSSDHAIDLAKTKTSTSGSQDWYHLKLTVTESTASYVLTGASGSAATENYSGSKDISSLTSKDPTYIWVLVGKKNGELSFDNFHIYDYSESSSGDTHTLTAPTIAWKESHVATDETAASMTYTITFGKGDELYWQLSDGSSTLASGGPVNENTTDVSKVGDDKLSYDVTVTQSGTLSAWSTYKESTRPADVTSLPQPKFYSVAISEQSGLCSFSSAKSVLVPDDVSIYIITKDDNVGEVESSVTISKVESTQTVPSNKGVFLYKKDGGSIQLPAVYGELSTDVEQAYKSDVLDGTKETTFLTPQASYMATDGYYYCLKKDAQAMGRVKEKTTIPANKAYYKSTVSSAKLDIVFDDDATGIDGVKAFGGIGNAEERDVKSQDALYNLAGQRVDDTYKGIVVRNGRKYVNR